MDVGDSLPVAQYLELVITFSLCGQGDVSDLFYAPLYLPKVALVTHHLCLSLGQSLLLVSMALLLSVSIA